MKKIWCLAASCVFAVVLFASVAGAQPSYPQGQTMQPQMMTMMQAPPAAPHATATVSIHDFMFWPAQLSVQPGTTVTWVNQGAAPHTVTADNGAFDSGALQPGQSFSFTFSQPGTTYAYHCSIHPFMTGSVTVAGGG